MMLFQMKLESSKPAENNDHGRVGAELAGLQHLGIGVDPAHRLRHEAVEPAHEQSRRNGDHNAFGGAFWAPLASRL